MSLTKSLRNIGRPVVFYPRLGRFFGSNNAAVLFAQLSYWLERTNDPEGVFKTADEWTEETGLSVQEQRTARAAMKARGYLIEKHYRFAHRIYYKLDFERIDNDFLAFSESLDSAEKPSSANIREMQNQHSRNAKSTLVVCKINTRGVQNQHSYKGTESTSESTSESTADIKDSTPAACPTAAVAKPVAFDAKAWLAQRGVPDDVAADWLAVRKSKRARNSERAFVAIERAANAAGKDLTAWWRQEHGIASGARPSALAIAVEASATYGWSGFDAAWLRNKLGSGGGGTGASWSDREQDRRESVLAAFGVVARHQTMPIADALECQGGYETDLLGDCGHDD